MNIPASIKRIETKLMAINITTAFCMNIPASIKRIETAEGELDRAHEDVYEYPRLY